jgi:hypothetical protein
MVLKYFSALILCTAFLFEPLLSQTLGCLFGIDKIPGLYTIVGGIVTFGGLMFVA